MKPSHMLLLKVFGGGGGVPTLQSVIAGLIASAGGVGFWHPMRNTTGTISANLAYTGGVGAELFTNPGNPFVFTADNPTGYTVVGEVTTNPEISEVGAGEIHGGAGTGYINLFSSTAPIFFYQNILTVGQTYRTVVDVNKKTTGQIQRSNGSGVGIGAAINAAGVNTEDIIAAAVGLGIKRFTGGGEDYTIASLSAKKIGEYDALISGATLGQVGQLGANEAFDFDGSNDVLTLDDVRTDGLTAGTLWLLINPDTLTDGDRLIFKNGELDWYLQADGSMVGHVDYSTTDAETSSAAGVITTGAWQAVGMSWDDSAKTVNLYKAGVLVNDTVQVGVGTRVSNTNNYLIGDNTGTNAFDGKIDELLGAAAASSASQFAQLAAAAGVT